MPSMRRRFRINVGGPHVVACQTVGIAARGENRKDTHRKAGLHMARVAQTRCPSGTVTMESSKSFPSLLGGTCPYRQVQTRR